MHKTQAREIQVEGKDKGPVGCSASEQSPPGLNRLFRLTIGGKIPFGMIHVNGMRKHISQTEQPLTRRGDRQRQIARSMPGRKESRYPRNDFRFLIKELEAVFERQEAFLNK